MQYQIRQQFEKALRLAGYCIRTGKRNISAENFNQAKAAYMEINSWYRFWENKLTDENIKNYIARNSDKVRLIIPRNKAGNKIESHLFN
jgi:hypothetical protein